MDMEESRAEAPSEGRAPDEITQSERWARVRIQHILAVEGLAEGQCGYCGAYRLDGLPPVVHQPGCAVPYRGRA